MNRPSAWEKEAAKATSEVARRAIRRLDMFEWFILLAAVGMSIGGGWLVASVLVGRDHERHRLIWVILSVVLLVVPGVAVFVGQKREERKKAERRQKENDG